MRIAPSLQRVVLALIVTCVASTVAHAQSSADFAVTGTILPGVCRLAVADVDLGTYKATEFTGAYTTPLKPVDVVVSQCDPLVTRIALRFDGSADTNDATLFEGVRGIGIELQDATSGTRIAPGDAVLRGTAAGTHAFRIRFAQSAPGVAAGRVTRPITVTMTYN